MKLLIAMLLGLTLAACNVAPADGDYGLAPTDYEARIRTWSTIRLAGFPPPPDEIQIVRGPVIETLVASNGTTYSGWLVCAKYIYKAKDTPALYKVFLFRHQKLAFVPTTWGGQEQICNR